MSGGGGKDPPPPLIALPSSSLLASWYTVTELGTANSTTVTAAPFVYVRTLRSPLDANTVTHGVSSWYVRLNGP